MTHQFGEILIHEGESLTMYSLPLNDFLKTRPDLSFSMISTACWRGYFGTWEIKDNKLYLVSLSANIGDDERVGIDFIFPDQEEVYADWFNGEIRLPTGDRLEYHHMGFASIFEKD
jgi:hypothetical protein